MKEKIRKIPVLGGLLQTVLWYGVTIWKWITHKLLREQISKSRWNKIRREIVSDFADSQDADIRELIENLKRQKKIRTFNYPFFDNYDPNRIEVFYDDAILEGGGVENYPYVIHEIDEQTNRRVYFPKEFNPQEIARSYCELLREQDKDSPHCYTNDDFRVKDNAVILDLGVAEGNFSIDLVDRAKHIYLFEGDSCWWKPLELTFRDWKEKVTIVRKYVSDTDDEQFISLKTFLKEEELENEVIFIKMDIEGYEECVLKEGLSELQHLLKEHVDLTMAVCSYHKQDSEEQIRKLLTEIGFKNIKPSKGFMILNNFCEERIYPYFRRGLVFASSCEDKEKE